MKAFVVNIVRVGDLLLYTSKTVGHLQLWYRNSFRINENYYQL